MNSDDRILRALKALQQADQDREAPLDVEARLVAAFRQSQHKRHDRTPPLVLARLALAALAAAAVVVLLLRLPGANTQDPQRSNPQQKTASAAVLPPRSSSVEPAPAPSAQLTKATALPRRVRPAPYQAEPPREIVTEFFPLMDAAPPLGRGQLLRVAVPASTMRTVGLPVREERLNDPVQADVLIGEEGMARAIRFVSFIPTIKSVRGDRP